MAEYTLKNRRGDRLSKKNISHSFSLSLMSKSDFLNEILDLTQETVEQLQSVFKHLEISVSELPSILVECVSIRPQKAELYVSFFNSLQTEKNGKLNKIQSFNFLQNMISAPLSSEKVFFLYLLLENNIVTSQNIIQIYSSIDADYKPLFLIFLPELIEMNPNESILKIAEKFQLDIQSFKDDDWKQFKSDRSKGQNPDFLLSEIRNKNENVVIPQLDEKVPFSIFERSTVLKEATFAEYIIYFFTEKSLSLQIDNTNFEKYLKMAIIAKNVEFIKLALDKNFELVSFLPIIQKYKFNELIALIENENPYKILESEMDDDFLSNQINPQKYKSRILKPEEIDGMIFTNKECCLQSLNLWAYRQGVRLVKNQATSAKVLQLRCKIGKRKSSSSLPDTSNKSDCMFKLSISERKDKSCKVSIPEQSRGHIHQLNALQTSHFLLPREIIETVRILRKSGTTPTILVKYIQFLTGIVLSASQVDELSNYKNDELINEPQELYDYIISINGKAEFITKDGKNIGLAAFTPFELSNIERFGDVASIVKIEFPNKNNWNAYQIVGVNQNLEVISFGSFFYDSNEDLIKEFLEISWNLSHFSKVLETIITSNDSQSINGAQKFINIINTNLSNTMPNNNNNVINNAMSNTINNTANPGLNNIMDANLDGNPVINHVICALDVYMTMKSSLHLVNDEFRSEATKIAKAFVYSKSEEILKQNIENLIKTPELSPVLSDNNIIQNISKISRAILGNVKTYGLNYVSLGSKLSEYVTRNKPNKYLSLLECMNELELNKTKFTIFLSTNLDAEPISFNIPMKIGSNILDRLSKSNKKAERLEATVNENATEITIFDPEFFETHLVTYLNDKFSCSCHKVSLFGLPCSHLIKAHKIISEMNHNNENDFPFCDISSHFIEKKEVTDVWRSVWTETSLLSNFDEDMNDISPVVDYNYQRFAAMMNEAKETAKVCSLTEEDTEEFIKLMRQISHEKQQRINGNLTGDGIH
ncbi:hypothetical protein TRFO_24461 [Tritrichomonas foetus]|uniref:SWIM-type domain-containing protein n=1 Tax=Tritrichomonas foetus TaxID=1144522 RepID=A0A1J4K7L6_9EUKA|nr:hypothetical protein TRFO_24461 [Tritrichomonas foetus]|eukprot:OHT07375.1 hypothetical protein TRFO_24461 [Tritrichomonas foetus]